jgi:hypothetical protein
MQSWTLAHFAALKRRMEKALPWPKALEEQIKFNGIYRLLLK